jgi:galactoside O-acetyltransferase
LINKLGLAMFKYTGKNITIYPLARILFPENLSLGDETVIADFCFIYAIGKGIELGNFCHITEHGIIQAGGLVKFGDFSSIGPRTTILASSDNYEGEGFHGLKIFGDKYRKVSNQDVIFGRHVQVGMGSIVMPGVILGDGCQIGAGSLVTKSMPAWTLCYGSPCKPIREYSKDKILRLEDEFLKEYYG